MSISDHSNLSELLDLYRQDRSRVVFFIGAGLSIPLFPSWSGLLKHMVEACFSRGKLHYDKDELLSYISKGENYSEIAEACVQSLGETAYRDFLEQHFDVPVKPEAIPASYRELFKLEPRTIITTNYDHIPDVAGKGTYLIFTNKNIAPALRAVEKNRATVVKLHGDITDQNSIVFTRKDYDQIIHNNEGVKNFLRAIFSTKTVVFLGFGLADLHIDLLLGYLHTITDRMPITHYALMSASSKFQIDSLERKYGIKVIPYNPSDDSHPEVRQFIRTLAKTRVGAQPANVTLNDVGGIGRHVSGFVKNGVGSPSFLITFEKKSRRLFISYTTRAGTPYELQKEILTLGRAFDFDSAILGHIVISVQINTPTTKEIDAYFRTTVVCSFPFNSAAQFSKGRVDAKTFWKSIQFFVPEMIGTFAGVYRPVSVLHIGAES